MAEVYSREDLEWFRRRVSNLLSFSFADVRKFESAPNGFQNIEMQVARLLVAGQNVDEVVQIVDDVEASSGGHQSELARRYERAASFRQLSIDFVFYFLAHHLARLLVLAKSHQGELEIEIKQFGAGQFMAVSEKEHTIQLKINGDVIVGLVKIFRQHLTVLADQAQLENDEQSFYMNLRAVTSGGMVESQFREFWQQNLLPIAMATEAVQIVSALAHEVQHIRQYLFDADLFNSITSFPAEIAGLSWTQIQEKYPQLVEEYITDLGEIHACKLSVRYLRYLLERHRQGIFVMSLEFVVAVEGYIKVLQTEIRDRLAKRKQAKMVKEPGS